MDGSIQLALAAAIVAVIDGDKWECHLEVEQGALSRLDRFDDI